MKLETFVGKFDQYAEASDAIARMRELVLQLAVQGRLVSQSPNEEPADALAVTISEDRATFVKAKSLARQREFAPVTEDQYPFTLPSGWVLTRLGNLCRVQAGYAFASAAFVQGESGVPMIRIRDITKDYTQINFVGEYREEFVVDAGDYLIGMDGNFTVAKWRGPRALLNQRVSRLQWYSQRLEPSFFAIALQYRLSELQGTKAYTTVDHLSSGQIENAVVPLPPLAEQKRIVAKVDELMALCDRLEAQQMEREMRHAPLARASLARFADAPTPANLTFLFHKSYDITPADLRKSILTLAVQGKLVPQNPSDEPAEILLSKIQKRRSELQSTSRIPKPESQFSEDDGCEETLPYSWKQARIGDLCLSIVPQRDKPLSFTGDIPWVTLPVFKENSVSLELGPDCEGLSQDEVKKYRLRIVPAGSVLMSCIGRFGLVAVLDRDVVPNQQIHGFYFPTEFLEGRFLCYSIMAQKAFLEAQATTTTIAYLNKTKCESVPIALPPLAEQRRIVTKVDELMGLVNELETQLAASRVTAANLLEAVVAELTIQA